MAPQPNMQSNLAFVEDQLAHVESKIYEVKYADLQYTDLIPVDFDADEWADSVLFYSMDGTGKAEWIGDKVTDIPMVSESMAQHDSGIHMQGIGYDYGLPEVMKAARLGFNLDDMKARRARRVSEEATDRVALRGDTTKSMSGLLAYPGVPVVVAPNGAGASPLWANKTDAEILSDVNNLLTGLFTGTQNTAMADTLLLPTAILTLLATRVIDGTTMTLLKFIEENNLYTLQTGQKLRIRAVLGLETAGTGGVARAMAYRKDEEVLKMHIPMPIMFLPPQIVGLRYVINGMFRLGGLDIRLPLECRYLDGI